MANPDILAVHASLAPTRPAVIEGDHVSSYGELNVDVNRLANGLLAMGIKIPGTYFDPSQPL